MEKLKETNTISCSIGLFEKENNKYVFIKDGIIKYQADMMIPECWVESVF